jgi:regulatory protein YycI of two-component signal transduction system YycFG
MNWNKANTILITAFIILNIFLFISYYEDIFNNRYEVSNDEEFIEDVKNILGEKNIELNCQLPEEMYILSPLDAEYEIIDINKDLLGRYLGPGVEPVEGITEYTNENGEKLEVIEGKKLHYTLRERVGSSLNDKNIITKDINKFIADKKIDADGYLENYRNIEHNGLLVVYTKKYNNFSMDNSYMHFYFDEKGIYKFEMQNIISAKETAEKIRTFSAAEALPKLLPYNIENKKIIHMEMTYYREEDENWQYISRINSYPVWKVIFSDGTQKHLSGINTYDYEFD